MKWTKATNKTPEIWQAHGSASKRLPLRTHGEYFHIGRYFKDDEEYFELVDGVRFFKESFHLIEWLDESVSPSPTDESALKDEAEKLYPVDVYSDDSIERLCQYAARSAYLAGRRKTIEQLKAEPIAILDEIAIQKEADMRYDENDKLTDVGKEFCKHAYKEGRRKSLSIQQQMGLLLMDKDGEIEGLKAEVARLEKLLKQTEEISRIATEGLKEASKEVDQLRTESSKLRNGVADY